MRVFTFSALAGSILVGDVFLGVNPKTMSVYLSAIPLTIKSMYSDFNFARLVLKCVFKKDIDKITC